MRYEVRDATQKLKHGDKRIIGIEATMIPMVMFVVFQIIQLLAMAGMAAVVAQTV